MKDALSFEENLNARHWYQLVAGSTRGPATQHPAETFYVRLDAIQPWDRAPVDATTDIKVALRLTRTTR